MKLLPHRVIMRSHTHTHTSVWGNYTKLYYARNILTCVTRVTPLCGRTAAHIREDLSAWRRSIRMRILQMRANEAKMYTVLPLKSPPG